MEILTVDISTDDVPTYAEKNILREGMGHIRAKRLAVFARAVKVKLSSNSEKRHAIEIDLCPYIKFLNRENNFLASTWIGTF